jgi:inorganic pyrophosphatase
MGVVVKCKPIGYLIMSDEEGVDNKLIAVPVSKADPYYADVQDIADIPKHVLKEVEIFFADYKKLEPGDKYKHVKVEGYRGSAEAKELVMKSIAAYGK